MRDTEMRGKLEIHSDESTKFRNENTNERKESQQSIGFYIGPNRASILSLRNGPRKTMTEIREDSTKA